MLTAAPPEPVARTKEDDRVDWLQSIPFWAVHVLAAATLLTGVTAGTVALCVLLYAGRMFFVTAGYHRYFSHRSFRASRPVQFLLALGGTTAVQKGPLWWASHHRLHHRYADTDRDLHSPARGFWWSHVGWILARRYKRIDRQIVADLARYPELRALDRLQLLSPIALGAACFFFGGVRGLVVGFALSTVLLWHATFSINSLAHLVGRRRFATRDDSRNSFVLALATHGEGWHNNHHYCPTSARQGFRWWEVDVTWYALRLLAAVRVVRDLRQPRAAKWASSPRA